MQEPSAAPSNEKHALTLERRRKSADPSNSVEADLKAQVEARFTPVLYPRVCPPPTSPALGRSHRRLNYSPCSLETALNQGKNSR